MPAGPRPPSYGVGHAAQVLAFTPDDSLRAEYPSGFTLDDWANDLPRLIKVTGARYQGSGIRDQGSGIRDQGSGIRCQKKRMAAARPWWWERHLLGVGLLPLPRRPMGDYGKLRLLHRARVRAVRMQRLVGRLPPAERPRRGDQLIRAANSIKNNMVEGSTFKTGQLRTWGHLVPDHL